MQDMTTRYPGYKLNSTSFVTDELTFFHAERCVVASAGLVLLIVEEIMGISSFLAVRFTSMNDNKRFCSRISPQNCLLVVP